MSYKNLDRKNPNGTDNYTDYSDNLFSAYQKIEKKLEDLSKNNLSNIRKINALNNKIDKLENIIAEKDKIIEEQGLTILKLKSQLNKDSSNSSKPSSTNGYKKVITNRRVKSDKPIGGQKGHAPHSLNKTKLQKFIDSGDIVYKTIDVNKNAKNKNKRFISKNVIDFQILKTLTEYRYYPDEHGKYNIPVYHNQKVQYGSNIKAFCTTLLNDLYNSTDGVTRFVDSISNGGITLSKGTLINWNNTLSSILSPEVENIEEKLLNSYYINHDESNIKVNGNNFNIVCACNNKYTRLWACNHKNRNTLDKLNFLTNYKGIIVKDGTSLYDKYGFARSQCISHIQRYLKGIYENNSHSTPKMMSEFLTNANNLRNEYISKGKENFDDNTLSSLLNEYDSIISLWNKEYKNTIKSNFLLIEEERLLNRMSNQDKNEIIYFLKDFKVPSTNNQAETDQRNVKIKQKIGKFRSTHGADDYSMIRSCINTYKKNGINVLYAFSSAFEGNTIIV